MPDYRETFEFTMFVEVTDPAPLYEAALARALKAGLGIGDAVNSLMPNGEPNVAEWLRWMLEPESLPGTGILESACYAADYPS